jgi:UDP-N-acetylmuramoylalanine--D-glutamate ligase
MANGPISDLKFPFDVLVVGLAREGTALARFLAEHGARVTATDVKPAEALAGSLATLAGLPLTYVLGDHPLSLLDRVDVVMVSPGVPLEIPLLVEAVRRGLPLSSETRLFARLCPAPIAGITGSSGKTTTTALLGEMLRAAGRRTWVGGNIGQPLIGCLESIVPADSVVMELSSFQLEFFAPWSRTERRDPAASEQDSALFDPAGWSPPVAAILNLTPNHLDRHPTMEAYVAAKAHILRYQRAGDFCVLNRDDPVTRRRSEELAPVQRVLWFSLEREVPEGAFLRGDELILSWAARQETVCRLADLRLMGRHNVANMLAACALAAATGVPVEAMRQVATSFCGVEHRLELVRERNHVRWYNDTIATTPERTVAALRAFDAPLVLLAGGRDKHLPWEEMAALTWLKVRHLVLFGEAAGLIEHAMRAAQPEPQAPGAGYAPRSTTIHRADTLERAVEIAAEVARPGDVVLLSPGGTSFDAYPDFVARGEHFRQLVRGLE